MKVEQHTTDALALHVSRAEAISIAEALDRHAQSLINSALTLGVEDNEANAQAIHSLRETATHYQNLADRIGDGLDV